MADFVTNDFQFASLSGTTFTIGFNETDQNNITWGELSNVDGQFQLGETFTEGFGNATYQGAIIRGGYTYHMFLQAGQYVLTAELDAAPGLPIGTMFDQSELSLVRTTFCFAEGTLIDAPTGAVEVQDLTIGDCVCTADGRAVPVKWIGRQRNCSRFGFSEKMEPVQISAGALGGGLPRADLTVSAYHGMVLDGMVVNASAMVNGSTIKFVPMADLAEDFTYYHVETEAHDVILANGAASETFIDIPGRSAFDNFAEYLELYGVERIVPEMDMPRVTTQRLLPDALRARLGIAVESCDFADIRLSA